MTLGLSSWLLEQFTVVAINNAEGLLSSLVDNRKESEIQSIGEVCSEGIDTVLRDSSSSNFHSHKYSQAGS